MCRKIIITATIICLALLARLEAMAYEVVVNLGSTAKYSATIAMVDRSQWPEVADLSWGPLANLSPIFNLTPSQQTAIFNNFKNHRAIAEITYELINWTGSQDEITYIESFGYSVPYLLSLDWNNPNGTLTRPQVVRLKARFPDKKIISLAQSWELNEIHVKAIEDVVDGVCVEFFPHQAPSNVAKQVAPFAEWAYKNDKILIFLMPPLPDDYLGDRFVYYSKQFAQIIYDENRDLLPSGWMKSDKFIFAPANYTFGESLLPYAPEWSENSVLAAVKALLYMRPQLEAGPVQPEADHLNEIIYFLLK